MAKASDNVFPRLLVSEGGSTTTPASGRVTIYAKADGLLYQKDDAGTETLLAGGTAGAVATDSIWDAKGDLAGGTGANTAAKLTVGADGSFLVADAAQATGLKWLSAMTSWTPSLTAASVNPTLGSGSFANGKHISIGKLVIARAAIGFGTSGTAAGTGEYYVSLPIAAVTSGQLSIGHGYLFDASTGNFALVAAAINTSTTVKLARDGAGTVTSAAPWAWAASDQIALVLQYEAA